MTRVPELRIGAEITADCALTEQSASPFATKLLQIELKGKGSQSGGCIPPENTGDSQDTEGRVLEEIASALLSPQEHQRNAPRGRDITREHIRAPVIPLSDSLPQARRKGNSDRCRREAVESRRGHTQEIRNTEHSTDFCEAGQ